MARNEEDLSSSSSSRLIVKNIPHGITEGRIRNIFDKFGEVTDISLKHTKKGLFRKFCFVGFKTLESAVQAQKCLNASFINTSRIEVQFAVSFGSALKPRAWSKYSKDSSTYRDRLNTISENPDSSRDKNVTQEEINKEKFKELCKDKEFQDFISLTKKDSSMKSWANDTNDATANSDCPKSTKKNEFRKDSTNVISDSDYLRTKMSTTHSAISDDSENNRSEEKHIYVLKMRGFQGKICESAIHDFFTPIPLDKIVVPKDAKNKYIGIAYAYFGSEKNLQQALGRNKNFIGTRRIFLSKTKDKQEQSNYQNIDVKLRLWEDKKDVADEAVSESGRIFVRNLSYSCKEEDLEELFKVYGTLAELHLPIDRYSKRVKGYAYVTYMFPEHAVRAFAELDGSIFQGRMLHLLAAQEKKENMLKIEAGSSFKTKKSKQQKQESSSSHNWNTLFLGANAVADVMAEKFRTKKSQILDSSGDQSLGVRLALGETQIVAETRNFLIQNGVSLDSFSQAAGERSKSILLVKNLPALTNPIEIEVLFAKYGTVSRVVLPPTGVTAIVQFSQPQEARSAFRNLAYTKFHHLPLYLEWAPTGVFVENSPVKSPTKTTESSSQSDFSDSLTFEVEPEEGSVLSVKNLNFSTTEQDIRQIFEKCGKVFNVTIAKKHDIKNPGKMLSMGYGFVQYYRVIEMKEALKTLQHVRLDDHTLELRVSNRTTLQQPVHSRKKQQDVKQTSSKILVRNVPFEAKHKEIAELFRVFGQLKYVRLPKKVGGDHRGFAFVDFVTKEDANRAFQALCHSSHLYGHRLVLEWANDSENLGDLRRKTARYFEESIHTKKFKGADVISELENIRDDSL